ncbi:unnamed protein product [Protopolystoma xenopodis]|uniref:Uncharacterized protein n=1 Tax=Protopolystoma xenopodis TaxID=117903 RepID=A0A448XMJ7_9PLAT|nr:unnamed protein product [Protopolystoma xenopodis]
MQRRSCPPNEGLVETSIVAVAGEIGAPPRPAPSGGQDFLHAQLVQILVGFWCSNYWLDVSRLSDVLAPPRSETL